MTKDNKLTKEEIIHLSKLANLHLTDSEIEKYQKQLTKILDYINQLEEVNTSNVNPTSQVTGLVDVTRDDIIKKDEQFTPEQALKNSSNKKNNLFKVKAIFQNEGI